jgi:hypothetical protein
LPWEDKKDPEYVNSQKNSFMSNIPLLLHQCFPNSQPPPVLNQYLKYVASLNFQTKPSYAYCRNLLKQGVEDSGNVDDGMLVFGDSPLARIIENNNRGHKCRATEDPESVTELRPKKRIRSNLQQPFVSNRMIQNSPSSVRKSYKQFNNEKKIMSYNPEKQIKEHARPNYKLHSIVLAKYKPVVLIQRLSNEMIQKFGASLPEVSELTIHRQQTADTSSSSFRNRIGRKRRATEDPKNTAELKRKKRGHNTLQQPCASNRTIRNSRSSILQVYKQLNGKEIILGNPEKQAKKHATLNCNLHSTIPTKYEPVVLIEHLPDEVIQKFKSSLPEVVERTKQWQQIADISLLSNPTPAMLEIMLKMRQKASAARLLNSALMRAIVSKLDCV